MSYITGDIIAATGAMVGSPSKTGQYNDDIIGGVENMFA